MVVIIGKDYKQVQDYRKSHNYNDHTSIPVYNVASRHQMGGYYLNGMIVLPEANTELILTAIAHMRFPFKGEKY